MEISCLKKTEVTKKVRQELEENRIKAMIYFDHFVEEYEDVVSNI